MCMCACVCMHMYMHPDMYVHVREGNRKRVNIGYLQDSVGFREGSQKPMLVFHIFGKKIIKLINQFFLSLNTF